MVRTIGITALCTSLLTALILIAVLRATGLAQTGVTFSAKLENPRVKVSEAVYPPNQARPRSVRPTDQLIVFLDDCKYQRTDSATGEKSVRTHKSGDVIWHDKGEDAPVLVNLGDKAYRTLVIEVK